MSNDENIKCVVCNKYGQIIGYRYSIHLFVPLSDEDIEKALAEYVNKLMSDGVGCDTE